MHLARTVAYLTILWAGADQAAPQDHPVPRQLRARALRAEKVDVCHKSEEEGTWKKLSIPKKSEEKHIAHGDGSPGSPVPGQPGVVFNDECCVPSSTTLYTTHYTGGDSRNLGKINATSGLGDDVGAFGDRDTYSIACDSEGIILYSTVDTFSATGSKLATVDPETGTATPVGEGTGLRLFSLAIDPNDGTFYSASFSTGDDKLYTLDKYTGNATEVGPLGSALQSPVQDICFDSNGRLFGVDGSNFLYTINTANGTATLEGELSGQRGLIRSCLFDECHTLFVADFGIPGSLYTVDLATRELTEVVTDTTLNNMVGGAFCPSPATTT